MEENPRVVVVVVSYGNETSILSIARSVLRSCYSNLYVVGVCNGVMLKRKPESTNEMQVMWTGSNLGFAAACNIGIRTAKDVKAELVLLLNDDALPTDGCISGMVREFLKKPRLGLLCPVVLSKDSGLIESVGDRFNRWVGLSLHNANGRRRGEISRKGFVVDFSPGVALMARMKALNATGFFDERYFMYLEDLDLSLRTRGAGYDVSCLTDVQVLHASSSTSDRFPGLQQYYMMRNRFLLYSLLRMRIPLITVALSTPFVILLRALKERRRLSFAWLRGSVLGVLDGLRLQKGPSKRSEFSPPPIQRR